ncbi:MAG: serine protease [Syntrophales bacterium]|nr:serine protease [Syntrophales bacterium]
MKKVFYVILVLSLSYAKLISQIEGKMEDYSPTATQWLLNAVGDSGKTAIKSVYMIYCKKTASKGSGFLLKDGPIITNEHVIRDCQANDIIAISPTGVKFAIKDVKIDTARDLAALIPQQKLSDGVLLGDDADISAGEIVWTWGYPLGYNGPAPLLSVGYLSGFKAYKNNQTSSNLVKHLVVNAAFNSGNSGGPLFRANSDKVIGVVVNKALPLFTPFVKSAVEAFSKQSSGFQFSGTDASGKPIEMSEAQIVAEIVKSLRDMSQVMIGEAISVSELEAFLNGNGITFSK